NQHLAAEPEDVPAREVKVVPRAGLRSHWRTLIEVAAGALVALASAFYIVSLRHGWQNEVGHQQEHVKQLTHQLEELQNLQQNPAVELSLLRPGRLRAGESLPAVEIKPSTRLIHMEIRIPDPSAGPCDVRLVLSQSGAESSSAATGDKKTIWLQA